VTLSRDAATLLDRRLAVIGKIRWDTAQARSAAARAAEEQDAATAEETRTHTIDAPVPLPRIASNASTSPTHSAPPEVPAESATTVAPSPRRSSVQVILLIVGISLLSVAAVFFLVYAFINFGILGRSLAHHRRGHGSLIRDRVEPATSLPHRYRRGDRGARRRARLSRCVRDPRQ